MTPLQQELARWLRQGADEASDRGIVYRTEWLGYLPFGQYHWITVGGKDVSLACPVGWEWDDLEALVDAGVLTRVAQWTNPQDRCERESRYELAAGEAEPAAVRCSLRDRVQSIDSEPGRLSCR